MKYKTASLFGAGLLAILSGLVVLSFKGDPPPGTPYALWRSGLLMQIRNCERPATEDELLLCASFYCEQAVSRKLVAPQQTKLITKTRRRLSDGGRVRIRGRIAYDQIRSPSLPYAYRCTMERYDRAEPELLFRSRPG